MTQPISAQRRAAPTGLLFVLLAALLWGTIAVTVAALYRLASLHPVTIGFYRVAFAAPALLLLALASGQIRSQHFTRPLLLRVGLMGVAVASDQLCNFTAIRLAGVSVASLVALCTAPLLVAVFSALVWREALPHRVYLLLGAALIGTALLVYHPGAAGGPQAAIGVLWALGSAVSYATIVLCSRALSTAAPPLVSLGLAFALAAILLLPSAVHQGLVLPTAWPVWALLAYLGLVATGLAYSLFLLGMRQTPVTVASVITLLEPLLAVLLAVVLFHETLTVTGGLGGSLLLLALGLLPRMLPSGGTPHDHTTESHR